MTAQGLSRRPSHSGASFALKLSHPSPRVGEEPSLDTRKTNHKNRAVALSWHTLVLGEVSWPHLGFKSAEKSEHFYTWDAPTLSLSGWPDIMKWRKGVHIRWKTPWLHPPHSHYCMARQVMHGNTGTQDEPIHAVYSAQIGRSSEEKTHRPRRHRAGVKVTRVPKVTKIQKKKQNERNKVSGSLSSPHPPPKFK